MHIIYRNRLGQQKSRKGKEAISSSSGGESDYSPCTTDERPDEMNHRRMGIEGNANLVVM